MPIDPNIPLSVQGSKFGEIITQGIQQYQQNKRLNAQSEREDKLLKLKEEEAAQKVKEVEKVAIHSQTASFLRSNVLPLYEKGDFQGAEAALKDEILRIGIDKKESIPIEDLFNLHTQDPQRAATMAKDFVTQAEFKKYISPTKVEEKNTLEAARLNKLNKESQKLDLVIAEKKKTAQKTAEKESQLKQAQIEKADIVIGKVDTALEQVGFLTTGATGSTLGKIPGTPAYDLDKTIDTIKANIGFNELQQMRASSPTGGALGQVAVKELEFLQAAITSLDKGQSEDQLRSNLEAVKKHYQNWRNTLEGKLPEETKETTGSTGGWSIKRIDK